MFRKLISRISEIFVGRISELERLEDIWALACKDKEHLVYVFLNTPGVGKTTLINHFGVYLETEGKGLYIKFACSNDYNSQDIVNKEILNVILRAVNNKINIIEKYWALKCKEIDIPEKKENLQYLKKKLRDLLKTPKIELYDIYNILNQLSFIIPLFFAADEIQEFQDCFFNQVDKKEDEKETALHYFTRLLKNLLNSRILLVLSGTRYRILSLIGGNIGSPIRQKVKSLIIQKFEPDEVRAYVEQLRRLIKDIAPKLRNGNISKILENYERFLFAFSGGHPRTIENITEIFLINLSYLIDNVRYSNYDVFLEFLIPKNEEFFSNTLISSVHKSVILELTISEQFSIIKNWILNKGSNGQFLGPRPTLLNDSRLDDEIKRITYDLMNIGIIVQNGNYNYHLTSYFYFIEFLKIHQEPYEGFLKQVLHNKYFKLMCGRHSGFGYTFENILLAALIIFGIRNENKISLPLQASSLRTLKIISGKIKWTELSLEQNILYQTPAAEAIDAFVLQDQVLLLIQITTKDPPDPSKIDDILTEIESISKILLKGEKVCSIRGWVVSLFDFKFKLPRKENLHITVGEQLIPLLGKQLHERLKQVKYSFNMNVI